MPLKRLLTGRSFAPEDVVILIHVFEHALCDLKIEASDEESRDELAKLIVQIASDKALDVENLLDQVKVAWAWRYGGGQ
jgi:hypothetical protein